jgi:hypothetical protein
MRELSKRSYWILCVQFGLDIRKLAWSLRGLPRFFAGLLKFRKSYNGRIGYLPCLYDWYEEGGATKNEYFWQDLYVARKIFVSNPEKHVDIGSRVDGFVAHVASFRQIEVFDIRPVTFDISGVMFRQADLMNPCEALSAYCDSLSCLHALEHFGLGRYGDPIDPNGYAVGLKNMAEIIRPGGLFYLSVPIGEERVEFNAHRIFDPRSLVRLAAESGLTLMEFAWIESSRNLIKSDSPEKDMEKFRKLKYALGIFTFVKE